MPIVVGLRYPAPAGGRSEEELTFRTYHGYMRAICAWTTDLYPHTGGLLPGVADAVRRGSWRTRTPVGTRSLPTRAQQFLRNGWATEVLLNSPRVIGGPDIIGFANHWASVQGYYAVFEAFNALAMVVGTHLTTHEKMLRWAADQVGQPASPFVVPWTTRVAGPPGAWSYEGFGTVRPLAVSNLTVPTATTAPHLVALALKTTRKRQIAEHHDQWLRPLRTAAGKPRARLPKAELDARCAKLHATTLIDLLYRLRKRANYEEADAFLSGALSVADATAFHASLTEVVAATLLTTEIYLAHLVGKPVLEACADALDVPGVLEPHSVKARMALW